MRVLAFLLCCFLLIPHVHAQDEQKIIRIYQDADLSNHAESSQSIQKGIEAAFYEVGNNIEGYKVEFKYLDHRGNVIRSKRNYRTFLADPEALVIYSGIHSPPLITNRSFVNENQALTLVPWAAGGPITRYPSSDNWVFRLSVDDTRAGAVLVDFAMKNKACKSPHLLLENTPWGDSNLESMTQALVVHGILSPDFTRFGWNLKDQGARFLTRDIVEGGHDCIILVANAIEGGVIAQAVIDLPEDQRIPVISHWGITGGAFHERITPAKRESLDLSFIQSCFAFTSKDQTSFAKKVLSNLIYQSGGEIKTPRDLKAAVGFIHAYDLTKLLMAAIKQTGLTGDVMTDRAALRMALEDLKEPVQGLVKTYNKPYSVFDPKRNVNAHEALHSEDYCMARYGEYDEILILDQTQ